MERRADLATSAKDVTGSITPAAPAPAQPPIVPCWVVRDVSRGTALIQVRAVLVEFEPGDVLPNLGRVEAIRRQEGRWVVVTSKGVITSVR